MTERQIKLLAFGAKSLLHTLQTGMRLGPLKHSHAEIQEAIDACAREYPVTPDTDEGVRSYNHVPAHA
jgi:hypothetical protein